ncbi:tyrosine-type recombinase/integrase [Carboxylicivirga sp. M1479]|uniref:tyrosine-type recombinase/integrase n=1 Tax=Carboxylicivirga sp. M1479 TaxID=2594476 RepID=UPI001177916F|nr:tyrosine-type recombinase/integrase [Carboxylicivirga sp. M1479]TRX64320.1 tyrosine-type recombinase/integrase [Carboxylicivirga sp. M1479]
MQYLDSFYKYLEFERRNSSHTIIAYKNDMRQFCEFLNDESISLWTDVTSKTIRSWMVKMVNNGVSSRSVTRKISTLKVFFRFLMMQEVLDTNVAELVITPKLAKRLPVFVKEQEMDVLLDHVVFSEDFKGMRDRLILEVFYNTGMRLSELVGLTDDQIDFSNELFKVRGKRNKERIIPFMKELKVSLVRYMKERDRLFSERVKTNLFLTEKGLPVYSKLVYRVVNGYLNQVSTVVKKSPHVIRHTFATALLNKGADLNAIKELLGHSSLAATEVYTHNSFKQLNSIYKQAHPRAEKMEDYI